LVRRRACAGYVVVAGVLLASVASCSPAGHPHPRGRTVSSFPQSARSATSQGSTTPTATPVSRTLPLPSGPPCYVSLPASWARAYARGELWSRVDDRHQTGAPLPDGSGLLYYEDNGKVADFSIIGRGHKIVEQIGAVPNPYDQGQVTYDQINDRYGELVYAPLNGDSASYVWRLYMWERPHGSLRLIATNPTDGSGKPLPGGWVEPQLTDEYITWIQAIPRTSATSGSELMQYDIASGKTRVLYRGLVTSFVQYNDTVLYAAVDQGQSPQPGSELSMHLAAVAADTGAPTKPPDGLTFAADSPNTVRTDGTMIVWSTDQSIRAWTPSWKQSVTLVPDPTEGWPTATKLQLGPPTYPRIFGDYLVWNSNGTYVLDLKNGAFTRLEIAPSGIDMSEAVVSIEQNSAGTSYDTTSNTGTYDQHLLNLRDLVELPQCGSR
jgi:hypothetical protein